jgi:eukaryotic-like serine/threonine-protein kinase
LLAPRSATKARPSVPANVDAAIRKALQKLPADRFTKATQFAAALADSSFRYGAAAGVASARGAGVWKAATGVFALALVGVLAVQQRPDPDLPVLKTILDPNTTGLGASWASHVAISPDGTKLVVPVERQDGTVQLGLRTWESLEVTLLPGTEGARNVVFSPNGEWIAFATGTDIVKRPVVGGSTITIAKDADPARVAIDWLPDGKIWYEQTVTTSEGFRRVVEISEDGGAVLRHIFASTKQILLPVWIDALPDGQGALVVSCRGELKACTVDDADLILLDSKFAEVKVIAEGVAKAWYLKSGHVVYVTSDGRVLARAFDPSSFQLGAGAVPLFDGVRIGVGTADIALGADGTLLYVTGTGIAAEEAELVWVDRAGNATPVDTSASYDQFGGVALSPDGRTVATSISKTAGAVSDVYVKELPDGPLQRLTQTGGRDPTWVAGGDSVLYQARTGQFMMRRIARNGNAPPGDSVLGIQGQGIIDMQFTPDGRFAAFLHYDVGNGPATGRMGTLDVSTGRVALSVLGSGGAQSYLDLSPDGRFLAYGSIESGLNQVYVRSFPAPGAGHVQVSGGNSANHPIWSRGTKELFFVQFSTDGSGQMMVAEYATDNGFRVVSRRPLFPVKGLRLGQGQTLQPYDVSRDGRRFLMVRSAPSGAVGAKERLVLVRNWFTELARTIGGQ